MQAPRGKQLKINGNIVNVPADVANTVSMLPRLPSETSTKRLENVESNAANKDCSTTDCQTQQTSSDNTDNEDDWSEDEVEIPAGVTDTMLTAPDFVTDNERQYILNIAPGESNRPISIFRDKYSEELAYPGIFLGQKRPDNTNRLRGDVHYHRATGGT